MHDELDVSAGGEGEVAVDSEAEGAPDSLTPVGVVAQGEAINPWKVASNELVVLTSSEGHVFNMDRELIDTRVRISGGRNLEEHHGMFRLVAVSREALEAVLKGTEVPVHAVAVASPKRMIKTAGAPAHLGA